MSDNQWFGVYREGWGWGELCRMCGVSCATGGVRRGGCCVGVAGMCSLRLTNVKVDAHSVLTYAVVVPGIDIVGSSL